MNAKEMLEREARHEVLVEYAEDLMQKLLARVSARDALVELTGSIDIAELLIEETDGDTLMALQKAALSKADKAISADPK